MRKFTLLAILLALICIPVSADPVESDLGTLWEFVADAVGEVIEWLTPENVEEAESEEDGLPDFGPSISPGG